MPYTHDMGPLFVHPIELRPKSPIVHLAVTNEIDYPYRRSRSLVLRFTPTKGIVIGWWRKTGRDQDEAFADAVNGRTDAFTLDSIRRTKTFNESRFGI